jgi:hypothetical protein
MKIFLPIVIGIIFLVSSVVIISRISNTENKKVDCSISDWNNWSECSKPCGTGSQTRTRTIITESKNGGVKCPSLSELSETRECNTDPCPVDCVVSEFSDWSDCSEPCGTGMQTRTRQIVTEPQYGGGECPSLIEFKYCNTEPCPTVTIDGDFEIDGKMENRVISLVTGSYFISRYLNEFTNRINYVILPSNSSVRFWYSPTDYLQFENNLESGEDITYGSENFTDEKLPSGGNLEYITISINQDPYCIVKGVFDQEESAYNDPEQNITDILLIDTVVNSGETKIFDYTDFIPYKTCLKMVFPDIYLLNSNNQELATSFNMSNLLSYIDINYIWQNSLGIIFNDIPQGLGNLNLDYIIKSQNISNRFKIRIRNKSSQNIQVGGNFILYLLYSHSYQR